MPAKMTPDTSDNRYVLSSVDSALTILNLFFDYEEMSTNEIAKYTGLNRSTIFRFMVTLEKKGFVSKTTYGKYRLGLNLFSLGMLAYNRMELVTLVHPYLLNMAAATGETCHLAMLDDGVHVMFIDRALGTSSLKMDTALGYRQFAHCTATGKSILAFQSDQVINQYIRKTTFIQPTPSAIRDAQQLLQILDEVKRSGFSCDNEESEAGLTCFARPLLDASGRAYAAISISGPTTRMVQKREEHLTRMADTIMEISKTVR